MKMTCPVCGGRTKVANICSDVDVNYRRRECNECGYGFYTEEAECKLEEPIHVMRYKMDKARGLIKSAKD